jgi:hypothetical protein
MIRIAEEGTSSLACPHFSAAVDSGGSPARVFSK